MTRLSEESRLTGGKLFSLVTRVDLVVVQRLGVVRACRHLMDRGHLRQLCQLLLEAFLGVVSALAHLRVCRLLH